MFGQKRAEDLVTSENRRFSEEFYSNFTLQWEIGLFHVNSLLLWMRVGSEGGSELTKGSC